MANLLTYASGLYPNAEKKSQSRLIRQYKTVLIVVVCMVMKNDTISFYSGFMYKILGLI